MTACVTDDATDPRTTGPCALSERLGGVFAAQYFGEIEKPTTLVHPEDRDDDDVTRFVHAFFSPGADEHMSRLCSACGMDAKFSCGRCHLAKYCSRQCQKEHFPLHREDCIAAASEYAKRRTDDDEARAELAKAAEAQAAAEAAEEASRLSLIHI